MEEKLQQAYLYDFYGELLNEHQRRIYEDFVFNDLSLGEIAGEEGITRQGVADMIKRCGKKLSDYEKKLHLVEKFLSVKQDVEEIHRLAEQFHQTKDEQIVERDRNDFKSDFGGAVVWHLTVFTEKLQNVFKNLRSKGRLTEDDVKAALKEVKMALLGGRCKFPVWSRSL